jgi:hypothetical protein
MTMIIVINCGGDVGGVVPVEM